MLAADAAAELEAFAHFYGALAAEQHFGVHVCCAAQPSEANGSVEDVIDRGVDVGAEATAAWARQILEAVSDKSSPESILTALGGLHFDIEAFAKPVEHAMLQSAMLGVLDSEWERTHEEEIAPARFSAGPDPFANQPFGEAVKLFEQRQVLPKAAFDALGAGAKRQAFTVAGMASQEMLSVTKAELGRQLALARESGKGFNFREFKSFAKDRLESAGWTPANKSHVETVFRTNAMGALASGRFVEMRQPAVLAALPYWQIRGVNDSRARPTHKAAFGIVLPANDPFWVHAFPPFGYGCRCKACARSAAWVKRMGISIGPTPRDLPDPGFECGTAKMLLPVPDKALEKPQQPRPAPEQHAPLPSLPPPRAPGVPWVEDLDAIARAGTKLTENVDRYGDAFSKSTNRKPGGNKTFFKPAARRIGQEYLEELIGAVRRDADDAEFSAVSDLVESRRADGLHGWDGRIELDAKAHAGAAATLRRIGQSEYAQAFRGPLPSIFEPATEEFKQRNARFNELTGLRVYFHEELHGHSPATASSYYSVGALLEEVGTELTAREAVARAAPGLGTPEVRAWLEGAGGAYHRWIDDVTDVVMKHGGLDKAGARARIVASHGRLLQMKERFYAATGHLDQFVAGLDLPPERAQLVKADLANLK